MDINKLVKYQKYDFIIIGAGLAGLSFAYEVAKHGKSVIILEKEKQIGGLSKTLNYKGFKFDYCAHRFHTRNDNLLNEIKLLVGPSFKKHISKSRIYLFGKYLKYPFELHNLLRAMSIKQSIYSGLSFGYNYIYRSIRSLLGIPKKNFKNYKEWFSYYFGNELYKIMCEPYTSKIWKIDPSQISADWADQRFKVFNLTELINKILLKLIRLDFSSYSLDDETLAPDGGEFYYGEKGGAQDIPDAFARVLKANNISIITKVLIEKINENSMYVSYRKKGVIRKVRAVEKIISTIPFNDLYNYLNKRDNIIKSIIFDKLKYMDIIFVYLMLDQDAVSNDHWLYFPDREIIFNRSVEFKNWSKSMCPTYKTAICLDITCFKGEAIWTQSKDEISRRCIDDATKVGLIDKKNVFDHFVVKVKNAYPFYDLDYKAKIKTVVQYFEKEKSIACLGRTGIFRYNNSDGSIEMAVELARQYSDGKLEVSALEYEIDKWSY